MLTAQLGDVYFDPDMNPANPVRPAAIMAIIRPAGALPI